MSEWVEDEKEREGRKVRKRRSWIRLPGRKGRSERSKLPERAVQAEVEQLEKSQDLRLSDIVSSNLILYGLCVCVREGMV